MTTAELAGRTKVSFQTHALVRPGRKLAAGGFQPHPCQYGARYGIGAPDVVCCSHRGPAYYAATVSRSCRSRQGGQRNLTG